MSWNTCQYPECENWTYRPDVDYCETHRRTISKESENTKRQHEKKKRMVEQAKVKASVPRKPPNKVSPKREELNKEYAVLRPQYLLEHPNCEVKLIGCEGASVEIHHTYSGSNKVKHINDTSTWKATCAYCHRILHDKLSAEKARSLGLKI